MKIIRNKYFPFSGYKAINLFGILFVRKNAKLNEVDINHEAIHSRQFIEVTIISFVILVIASKWLSLISPLMYYAWYVLEWLFRLLQYRQGTYMAYRNISFERESYQNQHKLNYLNHRGMFDFLKYLK